MKAWEPEESDIEWLRERLAMLRDGGVLVFPAARLVYQVDRTGFVLRRVSIPPGCSEETHRRTVIVAAALGWQVQP